MMLEIERKLFIFLSEDFIFRIYNSPQETCSSFLSIAPMFELIQLPSHPLGIKHNLSFS